MGEYLLRSTEGGDLVPGSSSSLLASSPSCPCCLFLPNNLFLLPGELKEQSPSQSQSPTTSNEDDAPISNPDLDGVNPIDALSQILDASTAQNQVLLVDTHGHPHLDRERSPSYAHHSNDSNNIPSTSTSASNVVGLTCAVSENDWQSVLALASTSRAILPGLGIHPWYLEDLSPNYLQTLESLLIAHPSAIVGEIGLCKVARFVRFHPDGKQAGLALQKQVFLDQMRLAAKLRRPVSVHCVKMHGPFLSVLKQIVEEALMESEEEEENVLSSSSSSSQESKLVKAFPPAIAMHSFTGTAHHVQEILNLETKWFPTSHSQSHNNHKLFYFGFSHSVNVAMCTSDKSKRQGREAVKAVPTDRILVESDVHNSLDVPAGTAGAIAFVASALDKPLVQVARWTASNGMAFLGTTTATTAAESLSATTTLSEGG